MLHSHYRETLWHADAPTYIATRDPDGWKGTVNPNAAVDVVFPGYVIGTCSSGHEGPRSHTQPLLPHLAWSRPWCRP